MRPLPKILVLDELREVNAALLDLLRSLDAADWRRPTVHADRDVKDLVAHLLDGSLRRLAVQRDGFASEVFTGSSYGDLVAFVQRLSRSWMAAARRLSPRMLIEMTEDADAEIVALFEELDPDAPAIFPVAWAGDTTSPNWFDVAREYTEKWHHQAQIRDAVGEIDLRSRRYLHPVLSTFARGLPHAYRDVEADEGACVQISITGDSSAMWCLTRTAGRWDLAPKVVADPLCEIVLDDDTAWRLWTKGLASSDTTSRIAIRGDADMAGPALAMTCVMA
jgi:hypothetical protein